MKELPEHCCCCDAVTGGRGGRISRHRRLKAEEHLLQGYVPLLASAAGILTLAPASFPPSNGGVSISALLSHIFSPPFSFCLYLFCPTTAIISSSYYP
ncbi:hypothetical protein HDV57DRAFT_308425 [Trichoderma longibrachiatum]